MKHTLAGALGGLLLLAVMTDSHAQTGPSGTSTGQAGSDDQLQEVVVTAKSLETELPQQLAQDGTRVDTVSAAQILTGGYIDVAQALEAQTPGLYVEGTGPFNYVNASLQGSRTEDILWLVDDIRINNRLYAGTTPLDTIPASMIERIEVLDGGQALFYGTQAVAGAVNVVTKSFTDHPDGAFSLGADSNNGKHLDGYFRDELSNNYFVLYGTHDESTGIQPYLGSDYQPSGTYRRRGYDVSSLGAKYGYNITNDLAFSASYQHTDADRLDDAGPTTAAEAYNQRDEDLVSAKLDYVPSDNFKVFAKGYYHRWSSYYTEFDNGSTAYSYTPGDPGELTVAEDHGYWGYKDYGANLMAQAAIIPGLEVVGGYDMQNYIGHDTVLVIQQETEQINALFAQLRTTPDLVKGLHLAAGLRYNHASFGPSATVWNGGADYDFLPSLYLKANVGTAFRLPTDEELFANDPQDELGNPNLKPETSHNANVAIGGLIPVGASAPLHWEAMTFYRNINNFIEFGAGGYDADTAQYIFGNVSSPVRTIGEQLTLDLPVTSWLSADLNGTYSHTRQSGVNYQFDQIPLSVVKANIDYHPEGSHFGANLTVERIGDLDDQPLPDDDTRVGYGDYTVVDISGRYFLDAARHQRIDVHLDNLFNRIYFTGVGTAYTDADGTPYVAHALGLPRTFQASYTYSF